MSKETTYEVLSLKGDQWQTDTIYSDRDEAIEAARMLHGDPHIDGAKVISEVYDDKTGGSKETTIFNTTTKIKTKQGQPEAKADIVPRRRGRPPSDKGKKGRKDLVVAAKAAFWLLLILIGGLGVLYGFEGHNNFLNKI